ELPEMLLSIVGGPTAHLRRSIEQSKCCVITQGPAIRHLAHPAIKRCRRFSRQRLRCLITQLIQGPACLVKLHDYSILLSYDSVKRWRYFWGCRTAEPRPLPARPAGERVRRLERRGDTPNHSLDPCRLVRQVNEFVGCLISPELLHL